MGLDLKVGGRGYCVMPPSPHPLTGAAYRWEIHPVAAVPEWLGHMLVPRALHVVTQTVAGSALLGSLTPGESAICRRFDTTTRWADILLPAG